jgi:hypothetical protein
LLRDQDVFNNWRVRKQQFSRDYWWYHCKPMLKH